MFDIRISIIHLGADQMDVSNIEYREVLYRISNIHLGADQMDV